jgi:hypothetical protein
MNQQLSPLRMGQMPETITGFVGNPRQYRYDGSNGYFTCERKIAMTRPKEAITVIPLAFRLFHAKSLFSCEDARWVEMLFLNQLGNICHTMFHRYSVENFLRAQMLLIYDGADACDAAWTLTPVEKLKGTGKDANKYYLLEFAHERIDEKTKAFLNTIRSEHKLFREYTLNLPGVTELASKNWHGLKDTPIQQDVIAQKHLAVVIRAENEAGPLAVPLELLKKGATKVKTN